MTRELYTEVWNRHLWSMKWFEVNRSPPPIPLSTLCLIRRKTWYMLVRLLSGYLGRDFSWKLVCVKKKTDQEECRPFQKKKISFFMKRFLFKSCLRTDLHPVNLNQINAEIVQFRAISHISPAIFKNHTISFYRLKTKSIFIASFNEWFKLAFYILKKWSCRWPLRRQICWWPK